MTRREDGLLGGLPGKTMTRRELLKTAAVAGAGAAMAPLVAACGGEATTSPSASAAAKPRTGGHLRAASSAGAAAETLDIHAPALTTPALNFRLNLYDSLLEFDHRGRLSMALAESLDANADGTQFTVRLKPDLVFHDGSAVNADAVLYSFERILNPRSPGLAAAQLRGLGPGSTRKVDERTVAFDLTEPNSIFPEALAAYSAGIVPVGYDPKAGNGVVGTGPFKLTRPGDFKPGVRCVMAKNENYWREGPYVDELSIIEFADSRAQMRALLRGSVEYCTTIPGAQRSVAEGAGMALLAAETGLWVPITMNVLSKPFDDGRVRQAMRLIADRQQIVDRAENGMAAVGNDIYGRYDPGYPKDLPQRVQDLEQAKSLLKQAGREGMTVKLTTSSACASTAPAVARVFAKQAEAAGITVKVNKTTGDVFWGEEYLKWPFAMDRWGTRGYLAQAAMSTVPGAAYDETHWAGTRDDYVALITEALRTTDEARRNELVAQAATMEHNDGGYLIHSFETITDAHSPKIAGALPDFSGTGMSANNARYRTVYFA